MPRLLNRQKLIPNGFVFLQPQSGWRAPKNISFDRLVKMLIAHRQGNPWLMDRYKLSTDYNTVANEVDEYNATVCLRMGWTEYVNAAAGGQPAPIPFRLLQAMGRKTPLNLLKSVPKLVAGGRVIVEWLNDGSEAVHADIAQERAATCAEMFEENGKKKPCPLNLAGDWTNFFTRKASEAIQRAVSKRKEWNLSTKHDEKLGVCSACSCPLPLKVHMPIERILSRIPSDSKADLHANCWIRREGNF